MAAQMRREIDFNRLRTLPGRQVANATPGQTIVKQGDPPGPLRVVVSGKVQLKRDGGQLAELGPGELFGEVALLGGGPQLYDAVATAPTTLLVLVPEVLQPLLVAAGHFPLGLAQTLADRAAQLAGMGGAPSASKEAPTRAAEPQSAAAPSNGSTPSESIGLSILGGDVLPPWELAKREAEVKAQEAATVDRSQPRPEAFYPKSLSCPVCNSSFEALRVRDNFIEVAGRDSDLMEQHRAINALYYQVAVCPRCYFAALHDDFGKLLTDEREKVENVLKPLRPKLSGVDIKGYRDAASARVSFELAAVCYGPRRQSFRKVAGMYHRLAWLARQAGQADLEKQLLGVARDGYVSSLNKNEADDPRIDITTMYLVADLSRRLGDTGEASKWASQVLNHPQIDRYKMVAELARNLWSDMRSARAAGA
jgi:uncharacterized protein